jgi:hypothetical protein
MQDRNATAVQDADAAAPLEICIFNIGANVNFPSLETTERVFRKVWEKACYAGFLAGREAARLMLPRAGATSFYRGHRRHARRDRLCSLRQRQVRLACGGAERGARARPREHPRRPSGH